MNSIVFQIRRALVSVQIFHKNCFCHIPKCKDQCTLESTKDPDPQEILSKVRSLPDAVLRECDCYCEIKPGVSKEGEYKNPEYHLYNKWSFYEAHKELDEFRMKQPSALSEKERE